MSTTERVTVTLSAELVQGIDRFERNRSRFIAEAVEHELTRRRTHIRRHMSHTDERISIGYTLAL